MTTIMVVDDEPDIVYLVSKMLKKEGFETMIAYSGQEAIDKLEIDKPDMILLDVMMPGINGWETAKKIKENPKYSSIPIAMLTVKSSEEERERSFKYGGSDAHIAKPIVREKMINTIRWLLKNAPRTEANE